MIYDIIIVGGGIAGLYSAYNIQKISPHSKILVLERYKKRWFGGRLGNENFCGVQVVNGAGVGRKEKDYLLIKLLKELKVPYKEFEVNITYANTIQHPCNVDKIVKYLRKEYKKRDNSSHITFKEFALPLLGPEVYTHFLTCAFYTDFENEDAYDTLYYYGLEDNYKQWTALSIPWKRLIETLANKVGFENIHISNNVDSITNDSSTGYRIHTEKGDTYFCNKVILATTIPSVLKLIPDPNNIYKQIHGQPFLRVYGKFSKASIPIMKQYVREITVVPGPFQKIIPVDADKGIYMIAYCDNENAKYFKERLENTMENRDFYSRLVEKSLGIPINSIQLNTIKDFYWPIGTHYYEPLKPPFKSRQEFIKQAQHPEPGMLVVGEMISENQGWTQGALDSVQRVLTKKWIDS